MLKRVSTILFFLFSSISAATTSPWTLDTGIRYWLGEGHFVWSLYDTLGTELLSRLTDESVTTNTAEGFWRLKHEDGVFFKGYFGGGSNLNGTFIDEDFPPGISPYSQTQSEQKHGRLNYFTADLGYTALETSRYQISPFIGYAYWFTHYNGFGCRQVASNPSVCSSFAYPTSIDILNDSATWNALRLGLNAQLTILDNLNFMVDAAYLYAYLLGHDYHNLRPDIRGEFFDGTGSGIQLDALFDWLTTKNLSMGVGVRWWHVKTPGYTHFEETAAQGRPQYSDAKQNNIGLILQSRYQFTNNPLKSTLLSQYGERNGRHDWQGFFAGLNLGYGTYFNNIAVSPFTSTPPLIAGVSPLLMHIQSAGFLAGGQLGYHWLRHRLLFGIESDLNYASVGGTNSITFVRGGYSANSSVTQSLNWFGTVRGKLGQVVSETLLPYVTAGLSFGNLKLNYTQTALFFTTPILQDTQTSTQTNASWTAGAGLEYAVSNHLRYKLEYLYLYLNHFTLNSTYNAVDSKFANNIIRLGINYHA